MAKIILYNDSRLLLVRESDGSCRLPMEEDHMIQIPEGTYGPDCGEIFRFPGYVAMSLNRVPTEVTDSEAVVIVGLRESWTLLPEEDYKGAAKGAELLNWSDTTRFCSCCGASLERATEISKRCPVCRKEVFPSLWPAIVVLVIRRSPDGDPEKDTALLVHARTLSRPTVQTLVAGFVETGESLEECVAREVMEETSLEITGIRYAGSQSWPFPHQLMLGFTAEYKGGELRFADGELTAGGFFTRDRLPDLPTLPSLSRRIIDAWVDNSRE